jgi:hypothetical protein
MTNVSVLEFMGIEPDNEPFPRSLIVVWALTFGTLALAFPFYSFVVFGLGMDRGVVADVFQTQIAICYWLGPLAPLLPLKALKHWSPLRRIHWVVIPYLISSLLTHLVWEGLWVFLHEAISEGRNEMWAYTWWAYIDGGDLRYYKPGIDFVMFETLSLLNGVVGTIGLVLLFRSKFQNLLGTLMVFTVGVVETALTWYYYGTEAMNGFANVNPTFMDLGVKFIILNSPWLVFPWFVFYWCYRLIQLQMRDPTQTG